MPNPDGRTPREAFQTQTQSAKPKKLLWTAMLTLCRGRPLSELCATKKKTRFDCITSLDALHAKSMQALFHLLKKKTHTGRLRFGNRTMLNPMRAAVYPPDTNAEEIQAPRG